MAWQEFWGAYDNTGPYNNVVLGGSPNTTGPYGIPLTTAHNSGYGYGIQFTDNGNYGVTFQLNLVGYGVTDAETYHANQHYVVYGGTYDYFIKVSVSNNNQSSWTQLYYAKIFSHGGGWSLAYASDWTNVASRSQWSRFFQLPTDTTHVKIELLGEDATLPHENVYTIQQIIPEFKPWAIRKANQWKTLNRASGKFQIRDELVGTPTAKAYDWNEKSIMSGNETGAKDKGTSRIRRSGSWVGQGKVGNQ